MKEGIIVLLFLVLCFIFGNKFFSPSPVEQALKAGYVKATLDLDACAKEAEANLKICARLLASQAQHLIEGNVEAFCSIEQKDTLFCEILKGE